MGVAGGDVERTVTLDAEGVVGEYNAVNGLVLCRISEVVDGILLYLYGTLLGVVDEYSRTVVAGDVHSAEDYRDLFFRVRVDIYLTV